MLVLIQTTLYTRDVIDHPGGLFDALDRAGVEVRTETGGGSQFGPSREIDARNADLVWYVVEESALTSVLTAEPGAHVVAYTSPLNRADEAELTRLHRQLADELRAQGRTGDILELGNVLLPFAVDVTGLDPDAVDRVTELNARAARIGGCRCAVVAFAVDETPDIGAIGTPSSARPRRGGASAVRR